MKTKQNRINSPTCLRICLYVLLLALGSCSSCKKDVDPISQLPPETQTGANTAGCLINGVAWIPNGSPWSGIKSIYFAGIRDEFLIINLNFYYESASGSYQEYISLCINDYKTLGERTLNSNTVAYPNTFGVRPKDYGCYTRRNVSESNYMTTTEFVGKVNLKVFDEAKKIVSGTFEFDAIDPVTKKVVSIRNGRFDGK